MVHWSLDSGYVDSTVSWVFRQRWKELHFDLDQFIVFWIHTFWHLFQPFCKCALKGDPLSWENCSEPQQGLWFTSAFPFFCVRSGWRGASTLSPKSARNSVHFWIQWFLGEADNAYVWLTFVFSHKGQAIRYRRGRGCTHGVNTSVTGWHISWRGDIPLEDGVGD